MKKTSSFILMATTIVGAVIAKNVSPLVLQNQPSKMILAESEEKSRSINSFNANTTADVTPISVVEVVSNNNSGIQYANYTATLEDGTLLGFSISSSTAYFCGAISSSKSVTVPETISYNNKTYTVKYIGRYSGSSYVLDFEEATSVVSLTIPSTATALYSRIPSTISELHFLGTTPPSIYNINTGITVYVPKGSFATYQNYCTQNNDGWNTSIYLKIEGWTPQSYTISVNTAGTLAYKLLEVVGQWTDVDELTISGHLNAEDMKYFSRMTQLRKLDLSQTDISNISGCAGLPKLRYVVLPSTVKTVEDNAFSGCSALSNISLSNVETIGSRAFLLCASLTSLSLDNVKEIGNSAFAMNDYDSDRPSSGKTGGLISVSMPKVTTIGGWAFSGCSQLQNISMPNVTSVGDWAFANCIKLDTLDLHNVKKIGKGAFYNRMDYGTTISLSSVLLSDELEIIPEDCFNGCNLLSNLTFPKSLKSIGKESIPYFASEVVIPEGVISIGSGNFTNSDSITIPSTAKTIGTLGGSNLKHVYCNVIAPPSSRCFKDAYASQATLHVPIISLNAYKLSDEWYRFNSIVPTDKELSDVTFNNNFTLTNNTGLANKPNFSVVSSNENSSSSDHNSGHLTVATDTALPLGKYMQEQNFYYTYGYQYDENGNSTIVYSYPNVSTLVNKSEVTADEVTIKMWLSQKEWNFISLPFDVNVSDITYPEGTLWVIRKYNGANRAAIAGDTWQNMANGQILNAGEGYILHCTNEDDDNSSSEDDDNSSSYICFTFKAVNNSKKNNIFTATDVEQSLNTYASEFAHNRSWNLIGNPYPSFYNSQDIEHEGVITVWNGNGYTAYSLVDDDYYLRPNEAFFVQCPINKSSMKFKAEGRSHEYTNNSSDYDRARVTRKMLKSDDNRHLYNFTLSNGQYTDKARLVLNENAKLDYEMSCDASKFMSSNFSVPQLYIIEKGQRLSIDERPLSDGVIALGVFCGTTDEYTISLATTSENNRPIILIDKETGTETDLIHDVYHFKATIGTYNERFAIKIGNNTTGVLHIEDNKENKKDIYNLNGQKLQTPQKGINIINNKKVIVK